MSMHFQHRNRQSSRPGYRVCMAVSKSSIAFVYHLSTGQTTTYCATCFIIWSLNSREKVRCLVYNSPFRLTHHDTLTKLSSHMHGSRNIPANCSTTRSKQRITELRLWQGFSILNWLSANSIQLTTRFVGDIAVCRCRRVYSVSRAKPSDPIYICAGPHHHKSYHMKSIQVQAAVATPIDPLLGERHNVPRRHFRQVGVARNM